MSFKNVEVKKQANVYHEGRVTSRTVITPQGEMKTLKNKRDATLIHVRDAGIPRPVAAG